MARRILISTPRDIDKHSPDKIQGYDKQWCRIALKFGGLAVYGDNMLFAHPYSYHLVLREILKERNLSIGEFVVNAIIYQVENAMPALKYKYGISALTKDEREYLLTLARQNFSDDRFWQWLTSSCEDKQGDVEITINLDAAKGVKNNAK